MGAPVWRCIVRRLGDLGEGAAPSAPRPKKARTEPCTNPSPDTANPRPRTCEASGEVWEGARRRLVEGAAPSAPRLPIDSAWMTPEQSRALELTKGSEPTPKNLERASQAVGDDAARWAFSQWELRKRAKAKFAKADEMLFDRDGLEMATHEAVAAYHASHFPTGERVADLTCGIGGDLIALARRGPVVGYETDPARADYARHNLQVHALTGEVRVKSGVDPDDWDCDSAFLDPQRRKAKDDWGEPSPLAIKDLIEKCRVFGVKLGPGIDMEKARRVLFPRVEAVSLGGECREVLSWKGLKEGSFAVHVESGESLETGPYAQTTEEPGAYLFHADPAAIKAKCLGALCSQHRLVALGDSDGYLTGPSLVESPWLRPYRVVYHGPADRKNTQAELTRLDARIAEVKTRAVRESSDLIRSQFKPAGDRKLTLAVWPVGKSLRHTLVEYITQELY